MDGFRSLLGTPPRTDAFVDDAQTVRDPAYCMTRNTELGKLAIVLGTECAA